MAVGRRERGRGRDRRRRDVRLLGDIPLEIEGSAAIHRTLRAGERAYSCLSWREELSGPETAEDAAHMIKATQHLWRRWLERGTFPDHPGAGCSSARRWR